MVYQVELLGDITAYSFRNMVMHSCDTIKLAIKENYFLSKFPDDEYMVMIMMVLT